MTLRIAAMLLVFLWRTEVNAEYRPYLLDSGDSVLAFFKEAVDADTARENCSLLGGQMPILTKQQLAKGRISKAITDYYTNGLQRVWIFYNQVQFQRNNFIYAYFKTKNGVTNNTTNWKKASGRGGIDFVDMYQNYSDGLERLNFCRYEQSSWRISKRGCPESREWKLDFHLYAKTSPAPGFKSANIYHFNDGKRSSALTNKTWKQHYNTNDTIYVPDVTLSTGDHLSAVKKERRCLQNAIRYGEGWQTTNILCEKKTFHVCQIKVPPPIFSKVMDSDPTSYLFQWNNSLLPLLQRSAGLRLMVKMSIGEAESNWIDYSRFFKSESYTKGIKMFNVQLGNGSAASSECKHLDINFTTGITPSNGKPKLKSCKESTKLRKICTMYISEQSDSHNVLFNINTSETTRRTSGSGTEGDSRYSVSWSFLIPLQNHSHKIRLNFTVMTTYYDVTNKTGNGSDASPTTNVSDASSNTTSATDVLSTSTTNDFDKSPTITLDGPGSSALSPSAVAGIIAAAVIALIVFGIVIAVIIHKRKDYMSARGGDSTGTADTNHAEHDATNENLDHHVYTFPDEVSPYDLAEDVNVANNSSEKLQVDNVLYGPEEQIPLENSSPEKQTVDNVLYS